MFFYYFSEFREVHPIALEKGGEYDYV